MKTLKALKITSILQIIFCFCCVVSIMCMATDRYCNIASIRNIIGTVGVLATLGWIVNPIPIICYFVCAVLFSVERKSPEEKQVIGKKWVWIVIWPVITTVFYLTAAVLLVEFTGGV